MLMSSNVSNSSHMGIGEGRRSHSPAVPPPRERLATDMTAAAMPPTLPPPTIPLADRPSAQNGLVMEVNRGPVPKEATSRAAMPSGNASANAGSSSRSASNRQHSDRYPPTISPYAGGLPFPPVASHLRPPLNWASVASWFFRPECPQMSTPSSTTSQPTVTSSTSTACSTKPQISYSNIFASNRQFQPNQHRDQSGSGNREEQSQRIIQAPTICTAIRCTVPGCSCECFTPGKRHLRYCETCKHGWVPHALDKLGSRHLFTNSAPEPVQPNAAFDIASLVLYGCQALPIRLKILLDRLFSVLQKDQVIQVLHGFGWTQEDYARGYILQEAHGAALDRWSICSPEEEPLVLQQFLRFGETRAITQQLLLAQQALQEPSMLDHLERKPLSQPPRRTVSPNHRPSPPSFNPSAFNPSRLPSMSPHQKHSLNFLKLPSANGPAASTSPPTSMSTSPLSVSPLNRLQNMQPFDFRKLGAGIAGFPTTRVSPDLQRRRTSEADSLPSGLNLTMSSAIPMCLPPPPPPPPVSAAISIANSLNHSAVAMAAAVTANPLAAASLVASSFPSLISSGSKSPSTADFLSGGGSSDFGSEEDEDDEENSHSALNLSRDKDAQKSSRSQQPRPGGHIRKATTPTKRHWGSSSLPLNLGTQFINPATGKKRVQCNVCLKTFCDKGALKIHFSAVHLREMHKCTVEGCNMMFSSRRSRNRHSANPNPKLHSPHLRRKISPHDGRSAQAHPLLIPPQSGLSLPAAAAALSPLNPFGPFPLLTPPRDIRHHSALAAMDFKQSLDLSMQRFEEARKDFNTTSSEDGALALTTSSHQDDEEDDDDDGIVVVGGDDDDENERNESTEGHEVSDQPEDFSMPSKRPKMSVSDMEEDMTSNVDSNEDSLSVVDTHSLKDDSNFTTNKRKRKSQNPTRCAVPQIMEDAMTDCDSSNDIVFPEPVKEQSEPEELVKRNREERYSPTRDEKKGDRKNSQSQNKEARCSSALDLGKRSPDVNANEPEMNTEIKTSLAPLFSMDKIKKEKSNHEQSESAQEQTQAQDQAQAQAQAQAQSRDKIKNEKDDERDDRERPSSSAGSHKSDESIDSSNALRHLESLSHGHFNDLMSRNLHLGLSAQPAQFPSLGFMMGGDPPSPARSHASSAGSSNGAESPDENSQNQIFGHFDNGQFISTMDVPIDKDNPRRCTACDGCNAAFPSKRSRDRHSANLNLHRKLLSTSSSTDKPGSAASLFMDKSPFASLASNAALHNEFLARLYADTHGLPLNLDALKGHPLPPPPATLEQMMLNGGDRLPPPPFLLPPLAFPLGTLANHHHHHQNHHNFLQTNGSQASSGGAVSKKDRSSDGSGSGSGSAAGSGSGSPVSSSSPAPLSLTTTQFVYSVEDEMPTPDADGNLPCRVCRTPLPDVNALREHCEQKHIADMYRCTVPSCHRLFTSRTKRNLHAENPSAHPNIDQRRPANSNCS